MGGVDAAYEWPETTLRMRAFCSCSRCLSCVSRSLSLNLLVVSPSHCLMLTLGQSQSPICLFVCIVLANIMAPISAAVAAAAATKTTGRRGIAHNIGSSYECGSGGVYVAASVSGCCCCCCCCNPIFRAAMFLTLTKWLRLLLWHVSLQQPHNDPRLHPHIYSPTYPDIYTHAHTPQPNRSDFQMCVKICTLGLLHAPSCRLLCVCWACFTAWLPDCLTGAQFSLTRSTFNKALHFTRICVHQHPHHHR